MAAVLRNAGLYVMRSAGSEGQADLIAVGPKTKPLLFVQCKAHMVFSTNEWNDLFSVARTRGAMPIVAMLNGEAMEMYRLLGIKDPPPSKNRPWERVTIEAA